MMLFQVFMPQFVKDTSDQMQEQAWNRWTELDEAVSTR
jgi:hypothetical protein